MGTNVTIVCKGCGQPFEVTAARLRDQRIENCSNECRYGRPNPQARIDKFWARINKDAPNGCWEWTGKSRQRYGYGLLHWRGKLRNACHIAWELTGHDPLPVGMDLLHVVCDNPPCVNPDHLKVGTHVENMLDMRRKGRVKNMLKPEVVRAIRAAPRKVRNADLSRQYGVNAGVVCQIRLGKKYAYID